VDLLRGRARDNQKAKSQFQGNGPNFFHDFVSTKYFSRLIKVFRFLKMR
jgi:hypothetical protein